jgi:ceramide synthetase
MDSLRQLTTISLDDIPVFLGVIGAYGVYRYVLSRFVLARLAGILNVKKRNKFIHRSFDLVHYSFCALLGSLAVLSRPYAHCVIWGARCYEALAPSPGACVCTVLEKIYYIVFCTYYIVDIPFVGTVGHDFIAVTIHHIVTVAMILLSVLVRVPAIGLVIMVLHDVVDVPLYLGKVFGYAGFSSGKEVALLTFAVMCTWFRIVNFPTIVWHSWAWIPESQFQMLHAITCVLLLVLMGCHIHWHIQITKVALNIFSVGNEAIRDTRSD